MVSRPIKIASLGSCMSEGVISQILNKKGRDKFDYVNHVIHNRSDYFLETFILRTNAQPDIDSVSRLLDVPHRDEFGDLNLFEECVKYLQNQSEEGLGVNQVHKRRSFLENVVAGNIDLILCDNFMDISSMLVEMKGSAAQKFFVFSGAFSSDTFEKNFKFVDYLSPDQAIENWKAIFSWLKHFNPGIEIYFIYYPRSVHGQEGRDPVRRAAEFADAMGKKSLVDAVVIEAPDVSERFIRHRNDWCHYQIEYYSSIAAAIFQSTSLI